MTTKPKGENWERAKRIAAHVLMNLNEDRTAGATHYHATYVDPIWNSGLIQTNQVGLHIFYRFPRGFRMGQRRAQLRSPQTGRRGATRCAGCRRRREDAVDESLLFAEGPSAGDDNYYKITPTVAPAAISTSTRTISTTAPRLMSIQTVPAAEEKADTEAAVDPYTARQTGAVSSASVDGAN